MECEQRGHLVSDDDLNFLKTKLKPQKILCESQLNFADSTKTFFVNGKDTTYKQIKNMYYTRFKANELRKEYESENNTKYDYVFQARLDLIFNSKMKFLSIYNNEIQQRINDIDNIIFYSWTGDNQFFNTPQLSRGGTDILYFGSPNAMNKLYNLYENLDFINLNAKCKFFDYFWLYNAIRQGMEIASFNFYLEKDYNILRTKEALDYINKRKKTNKLKKIINCFKGEFKKPSQH